MNAHLCWAYRKGRGFGTEIESLLGFLLCPLALCPGGYYYPPGPHFLHVQERRSEWISSVVGLLCEGERQRVSSMPLLVGIQYKLVSLLPNNLL